MNNRNWLISCIFGLLSTFAFCQSSHASLIGDFVDMSYNLDTQTVQAHTGVEVLPVTRIGGFLRRQRT